MTHMEVSDEGITLIEGFETFSPYPYYCPARKLTIGYGHVILPHESFSKITEPEAVILLKKDTSLAQSAISRAVTVPLTQNQFDALVSLVFNIGIGAFTSSTLLKKLNAGDYDGAEEQFGRWVYAGGRKLQGLVNRRTAEALLFAS